MAYEYSIRQFSGFVSECDYATTLLRSERICTRKEFSSIHNMAKETDSTYRGASSKGTHGHTYDGDITTCYKVIKDDGGDTVSPYLYGWSPATW